MSEDPNRKYTFDELARELADGSVTRLRALKILAGTTLGALIPSQALAYGKHRGGDDDGEHHGGRPGKKVTICHRPPGNPENAKTLHLGPKAAAAHLRRHNDSLGPCRKRTTSTTEAPATTTTSTTEAPTTTTTTTEAPTTTTTTTTPICIPSGGACTPGGTPCCTGMCRTSGSRANTCP